MIKRDSVKNPRVSIVIPVYNGAKYVRAAIDSALAQTYQNLEILVVDDGSTDETEENVKSYGSKVRYIKKENGGVSSALNLALKKMTGEYFSWLSHDDLYMPNKVEREVDFLRETGNLGKKVIVLSDYCLIDKKGDLIEESKKPHDEIVKKPEYALLKGHINGLSLLIPKSAFEEYGDFNTEMVCVQDYDMWWRMSKTYKFVHISESLVSTRWHAEQVTNTSPKVVTEGNAFYLKMIDEIPKARKEALEGSEYLFYKELADFYQKSVYTDLAKICRERAKEIFVKAKDEIADKKVSVVIPFYNRADVIGRAIDSVLRQTHKNWELILVDDGSADDVSKVEKIAKEYENIKLLRGKNEGASAARNKGIKAAQGDYIAFLDSDDEWLPEKLEVQLQYAVASKAGFSHTSYMRHTKKSEKIMNSGELNGHCERRMMYSCSVATPTVMLDRRWLERRGELFNTDIEIGEDTCFWLELMKNDTYLVGVKQPLTTVHVGEYAAAYTEEKQIVGLKEIIRYLLNDPYYEQYDLELSRLMEPYVRYVRKLKKEPGPLVGGSMMHKFIFFAKYEGLKSAIKRTRVKFQKVVLRKDVSEDE